MPEINLLPETLQERQKSAKLRHWANALSIILLIFASTVLVVVFFYRLRLNQNLQTLTENQNQIEKAISEYREEEGLFRFAKLKLSAFSQDLTKQKTYGAKIAKIREIFVNSATLTQISLDEKGEAYIAGEVVSFPELAAKLSLLNKALIFENIEISSLGFNQEKGVVEFAIQAKFE
ncbi:MAG: hypothetical protein FJ044_02600 [Candidatus Cloacimonetes bacterium]|nr:hypothetical protein [Candidatus Cloacimonadota bacterium]